MDRANMLIRSPRRGSELRSSDNLPVLPMLSPRGRNLVESGEGARRPSKELFMAERSQTCKKTRQSLFKNDRLRSLAFFQDRNEDFLTELLDNLVTQVFHPGQEILHEGDIGDSMYILNRGDVEVSLGDAVVAKLSDGTIFGELAVLGVSSKRTATVRASTFCDCRVLHRTLFSKVLSKYPEEHDYYQNQAERQMEAFLKGKKAEAATTKEKEMIKRSKALADNIAEKLRSKPRSSRILPRRRSSHSALPQVESAASPLLPRRRSTGSVATGWAAREITSCPELPSTAAIAAVQLPAVLSFRHRSAGSFDSTTSRSNMAASSTSCAEIPPEVLSLQCPGYPPTDRASGGLSDCSDHEQERRTF